MTFLAAGGQFRAFKAGTGTQPDRKGDGKLVKDDFFGVKFTNVDTQ